MAENDDALVRLYVEWLTPAEAAAVAFESISDQKAAFEAVWELIRSGLVGVLAGSSSVAQGDNNPTTIGQPSVIPARYWGHFSNTGSNFWSAGQARFFFGGVHSSSFSRTIRCFGIRLDPHALRRNLPPPRQPIPAGPVSAVAPTVTVPPTGNKGGRPRKEFWDDLLIAIFRQIHFGDFKPKKQAEIEAWMLDWASEHGQELSESSVKPVAKKLLAALKD